MGDFDEFIPAKGNSQHHENILQKAISNLSSPQNRPIGLAGPAGIISGAMGIPEENMLPTAGQAIGGLMGGFGGAVGGEGLGEVARQGEKMLRGQEPTPMDIPVGMGVTSAMEGIPRGIFNTYFGRQIANKTMSGLGKGISAVKQALANDPTAVVPSAPILAKVEQIYNGIKKPLQGGASHIADWIEHMKANPTLHATDLQQMEDSLGAMGKYGSVKEGAFQAAKQTDPVIDKATKAVRDVVSSAHDDLAASKGFTEFSGNSKKFAGLKQRWNDINPAKDKANWLGQFGKAGVGYMVGHETGSPLAGVGTFIAENILTNPAFKGAAFDALNNPLISGALSSGRLAGTELARDVTRK